MKTLNSAERASGWMLAQVRTIPTRTCAAHRLDDHQPSANNHQLPAKRLDNYQPSTITHQLFHFAKHVKFFLQKKMSTKVHQWPPKSIKVQQWRAMASNI